MGGDRTGIPFSGDRSGSLLRAMIARSGFESTFITNVIRCNPKDRHGRNREPTRREISNCRPFLDAELNLVKPRLIACLGRVAWREMGGAKFDPENPSVVQMNGWSLYPMYHPAYVNRGAYSANKYARDFARLASLLASLV
jgi:DNA polymerase